MPTENRNSFRLLFIKSSNVFKVIKEESSHKFLSSEHSIIKVWYIMMKICHHCKESADRMMTLALAGCFKTNYAFKCGCARIRMRSICKRSELGSCKGKSPSQTRTCNTKIPKFLSVKCLYILRYP